jgi:hypothetical protein
MPKPPESFAKAPVAAARKIAIVANKTRSGVNILSRTKNQHIPSTLADTEQIKHPAHVRTGIGITRNMENYESLKVEVHIESPCENTPQAKKDTHNADLNLAFELLANEAKELAQNWFSR